MELYLYFPIHLPGMDKETFTVTFLPMFVVLWDMTKCSVVNLHWYFRRICCIQLQVRRDNKDGGSMCLQNVGTHQPDYTVSHSRKLYLSAHRCKNHKSHNKK